MSTRRLPLFVVLLLVPLAGCLGGDEPVDPPLVEGEDALDTDAANNTTDAAFGAHSLIEAPEWVVGQWWGHHIFDIDGNPSGQHHNVAVVEDDDGYKVATRHETMALRDAQDDLPTLGPQSERLETTNGGEAFSWYSWPLSVNTTWSQPFTAGNNTYDVDFTVTYSDTIPTALGKLPGFVITGTSEAGTVLLYDYVPELGWFAELRVFDPLTNAGEPLYRIMNMGFGTDYADEWRTYDITPLATWTYAYDLAAATPPSPEVETSFEVAQDSARVYGPAAVTVDNGQMTLRLTDPDGETYDLESGAPGASEAKTFDIKEPTPGLWTARAIGAGTATEISLDLVALTEAVGTVTPATG